MNKISKELLDTINNSKDTNTFNETTPEGNNIQGKILLNHGGLHGSLLIETVNNEPALQFIRGFPKIKYFDENNEHLINEKLEAFEKLDGTCIGIYALKDHHNKIIEFVPKSRQKAVLDEHFQEMLYHCDTRSLVPLMAHYPISVIYMEMFGMLNEHTLPHKKTYIDVRLIGAVDKDTHLMVPCNLLKFFSKLTCIPLPTPVAKVSRLHTPEGEPDGYYVRIHNNIFDQSLKVTYAETFNECINIIKEHLDNANRINLREKGYLCYEGIVFQNIIHGEHDSHNQYIKVKPQSFLEFADIDGELTVPINEIRKEVRKIINENLTEYNEYYSEKETVENINEALREEYSRADVKHHKTQKIIKKELHKYIDSITDNSINRIVDNILENNPPETPVKDMMKWFAQKYPLQKHRSGDVYTILTKRLNKLGVDVK